MIYHHGFTYIAVLFFVALMSLGLAGIGVTWHTAQIREKEKELLFVGDQFRRAIKAYYYGLSGIHMYPTSLEELLKDPRQIETMRYLRKLYKDPMTGKSDWGLIKTPEGRIMGVYSLSSGQPIKQAGFSVDYSNFSDSKNYQDWKFLYFPYLPN